MKLPSVWLCVDQRGWYMRYVGGRIVIFNHVADARDAAKHVDPKRNWKVVRGTVTVTPEPK